jgi:hypothetical protein
MRAREWVFVLASAWVGAVACCTAVRALCGCAPAGQVYVPARDFRWRGDPARGAALAALAAKAGGPPAPGPAAPKNKIRL